MQSHVPLSHLQVASGPRSKGHLEHWLAVTPSTYIKALFVLVLMLISKYMSTWLCFIYDSRRMQYGRVPATVPYMFPIIGSSTNFFLESLTFRKIHNVCTALLPLKVSAEWQKVL